MPPVIDPSSQRFPNRSQVDPRLNFDYDYPWERSLKPGNDLHDRLKEEILQRARESKRYMNERHDVWDGIDHVLKGYVRPDTASKLRHTAAADDDKKLPRIIMPVSYASLETLLTYMMAAFIQNPIFSYEGVGPEDVLGAMLMQQVINLQSQYYGHGLSIHTMCRDAFAYGIGAVSTTWEREMGYQTEVEEKGFWEGVKRVVLGYERTESNRKLLFEGNKIHNIDPKWFLPDPNAPAHAVEEMEYVGFIEQTTYSNLLNRERDEESYLFNVRYLQELDGRSALVTKDGFRQTQDKRQTRTSYNKPVHVVWMYIDLIPEEWEIGSSPYPETWIFGVGADQVLIAAEPTGLTHGKKPISVASPNFDGYSASPVSKLEVINDIQKISDFLFTSHIHNVRRIINNELVVDPYLVNIFDVTDNRPGKVMRMRRAAWGRNMIDQAVKQLDVRDHTRGNVEDSAYLNDMAHKTLGANDMLRGVLVNRGPRISATQASSAKTAGLSFLEKDAQLISLQALQPIGRRLAWQTQQFMEDETYIKVTQTLARRLQAQFPNHQLPIQYQRLQVSPKDLVVNFNLIPHTGAIPGSESVEDWNTLLQIISQNPAAFQQIDTTKMILHIARQMGAKNIDDFVIQSPQVMPNEQVEEEVRQGNLVDVETALGGASNGAT